MKKKFKLVRQSIEYFCASEINLRQKISLYIEKEILIIQVIIFRHKNDICKSTPMGINRIFIELKINLILS